MNYIFETLIKYILADIWLIVTSTICLFVVINIFLKNKDSGRKWITLILFEITEHIIVPILLIIILLFTNSYITGLLFNAVIIAFLFGFIGHIVIGAKGREWVNVLIVFLFAYFFIFIYPMILIGLQMRTEWSGSVMMIITILLFLFMYLFFSNNPKPKGLYT